MSVLDQLMDLKGRGLPDSEIARKLQEQGVSPGEITDAFSKAQIKSAVSYNGSQIEADMQPSILGSEEEPERLPLEGLEGGALRDEDLTPPKPSRFTGQMMPMHVTQEVSAESEMYEPQEAYYPQQPQYQQFQPPPEGYEYAPSVSTGDTDTMIEVAEQVFSEKNKPLQKKIEDMNEFKALAQTKIDNFSDRLRRIETIIDRLQASILEKVGSYGHGLETVRKEMGMMQESFGKVVNKAMDSTETRHRHTHHQHPQHHTQKHTEHHTQPHNHEHHVTIHKSKKTTRKISKR